MTGNQGFIPLLKLSAILLFLSCQPVFAGDWGYEGEPPPKPPVEEQSAASMMKSIKKGAPAAAKSAAAQKGKPGTASSGAKAGAKPGAGNGRSASTGSAPGLTPKSGFGGTGNSDADEEAVSVPGTNTSSSTPGNPFGRSTPKNETTVYMKKSKPETGAPHSVPQRPTRGNAFPHNDAGLDSVVDKDQAAARCWLQLFQVVSKERMDFPEQKKLEAYMLGKGRQGPEQNKELRSILTFWPKLMTDLRDHPDLEMHYSDLFRALLRLHERVATEKTNVVGSDFASDADMVTQLLGLQRIAVNDEAIPFTEDAVNAYADMAFFIYEQNHAGRTIEASDNRALFAKVVVEKFNRAPTDADRRAMASFDLAWAKFKIVWNSTDEKTHQLLMEKLVKSGANSTLSVTKDPLLDLVLTNWPWKTSP